MGKLRAHVLRTNSKTELVTKLGELKKTLSELRIAQVTGGAASQIGSIGVVRKDIARVLTVINQTSKQQLRDSVTGSFIPKDLRMKKTRAIRRRLTKEQANKKTAKQQKKDTHFPQRVYAVRAL